MVKPKVFIYSKRRVNTWRIPSIQWHQKGSDRVLWCPDFEGRSVVYNQAVVIYHTSFPDTKGQKALHKEMLRCALLICFGVIATQAQTVPCGVSVVQPVTTRIVGGTVATMGSWPWTVMLVDNQGFIAGTGAIIHPNVILTSAQHFKGPGYGPADLDLGNWNVFAGEHNISITDPNEKTYSIANVILHENYKTDTLENDMALVILQTPITYNDHTRPACLPNPAHTYTVGETCYLPGWGSTEGTGNEEVLNQVAMPILADSVCSQHWQDFLPASEVCAGYEVGGKDFCGDDIGSPLMCKDSSANVWYIQGLASSGGDCSLADEPGIFEDVSQYRTWILQHMQTAGFPYQY